MRTTRTRTARAIGAIAAAGLLLTACSGGSDGDSGSSSGGGGGSEEKIELRFAWWGSETLNDIKAEQIELFEAEYPNITVLGEPSEYNGYYDKLATQVAGGGAPDAFQITYDALPVYAGKGAVFDLSDSIDQDRFSAGALDAGVIDGALYAIPTGLGSRGIIVNPAVFELAGVEIPDDESWTWEDYTEIAAQISEATPDGYYGSASIANDQSLMAFARQNGEDLYTADGENGVSEETATKFFQFTSDLLTTGGSPDAALAAEDGAASLEQSIMGQGKAAMTFAPINFIDIFATAAGQDLVLLNVPGDSEGKVGLVPQPTVQYAVSSKSDHPEEAALLIDFLLNSEQAGPINKLTLGIPAVGSVLDVISADLTPSEQAQVEFLDRVSNAGGVAQNPLALPTSQLGPIITKLTQDVQFALTTPEQAGADYVSQVEAALQANAS